MVQDAGVETTPVKNIDKCMEFLPKIASEVTQVISVIASHNYIMLITIVPQLLLNLEKFIVCVKDSFFFTVSEFFSVNNFSDRKQCVIDHLKAA